MPLECTPSSNSQGTYLCLPELWLRKLQPPVLYFNTNTPTQRFRMLKPEKEIAELLEDSDEMFKPDILELEAATGSVL